MSTNQYLIDAATRHSVFLQRYAGGEAKKAKAGLNRLRSEIVARLTAEQTIYQTERLQAILADIDGLYSSFTKQFALDFMADMNTLAANEAEFSQSLFNKATSAEFILPSTAALISAVERKPLSIGEPTIREVINSFGRKKSEQITQIIRDGVALGDTTQQIATSISNNVRNIQGAQLESIVKTATNSISSEARNALYEQNSDLLEGYRFIATLDSKTTLTCAANDQKVFQIGLGPLPPLHFGCRSTTIPVVKPEYDLGAKIKGKRPSLGGDGAELVSGNTSYGAWLKKQPKEFVDEALGVERSKLFRSGAMPIDKFVDPTGKVYTLDQLQSMNPLSLKL